ncbi:DUF4382 domain-containing protein [Ferrimonas gelatinilytica]|uniref:DUF4382 domain-containing protein n=1 Tax=Ferrimonas gelatinilytica TaxID=1255257 RepID=A0ABP9SCY5_9GAMM
MMKSIKSVLAAGVVLALSGCGSDNSSSPNPGPGPSPEPQMGTFSLGVSDAPVDDAKRVVLAFNDVILIPQDGQNGGDPIHIELGNDGQPQQIDLLEFQGSAMEVIVSEGELEVGDYRMCLYAKDGLPNGSEESSFVEKTDGIVVPLKVNSKGACHGYKPDTDGQGRMSFDKGDQMVTINTGQNAFVVEFDLRKALTDPKGQDWMFIKPNAVQLINIAGVGNISGELALTQRDACEADMVSLVGADTFAHAAYLYANERDRSTMGDIVGEAGFPEGSELVEPVAVANIVQVENQTDELIYRYEFGFIGEGEYSIGYTCTANADLPETHETAEQGFLIYQHYVPVTVVVGETTEQDLDPIL